MFRFAVEKICEVTHFVMKRNGLTLDDIGLLIPHQANLRIIEAAAKKLGIDMDRHPRRRNHRRRRFVE